MGWVEITLLVLWGLGLIANVVTIGSSKYDHASVGDCVFAALLSAGIATSILLWAGPLTVFGSLLVGYYFMWTLFDLGFAGAGGFDRPSWYPVVGAVMGVAFIALLLTVGITV